MTLRYSTALRNDQLDRITAALGSGATLKFYNGTQPASGGTVTTLVATATFATPPAPAASAGVLTFSALTGDSSIDTTTTVTWARGATSGGTFVIDFTVTATGGGGDITTPSTSWVATEPLAISSMTITAGNA